MIVFVIAYRFRPHSPNSKTLAFYSVINKQHFMEKLCRKSALKTNSITLLNFGNSPKQPMHAKDF